MIIKEPQGGQIHQLRLLWQEAFGDTGDFLERFFSTAFAADRCRCVTVDGELAAALYWFECRCADTRLAYIYAVATAKKHRGRGLCHALMQDTHRHLKEMGFRGVLLVPGEPELFAFYRRMGYETCCGISEISCMAGAEAVELQPVDAWEFSRLRREMLPRNGVLQEGESLLFLQTQALFFAGRDFLLTARTEQETLLGLELLGNCAAAPGIVRALGCAEGSFRIPGNGKPYAMYHPLDSFRSVMPEYFGFAFD